MSARAFPTLLESLIVRRIETELELAPRCEDCGKVARWYVVSRTYLPGRTPPRRRWPYRSTPPLRDDIEIVTADLCAAHGWAFVTDLGHVTRAGDP